MIAQNTCLQMCVIGRNTFVGAGSTFTDYTCTRALEGFGWEREIERFQPAGHGSAVGHNCRLGAGMIVYPSRMIESDVVLAASKERRVIDRDVRYEDSDHHHFRSGNLHHPCTIAGRTRSWSLGSFGLAT